MRENFKVKEEKIRRLSESLLGLAPLPTIIARIIGLIDDPRTTAKQLGRLITTDQVLATKILKMANSAFYGFPRRIGTIELSVVVLGFDTLKDVALSVSLLSRFRPVFLHDKFDMTRFWEHTITVGVACKMLARRFPHKIRNEAFIIGLLHDIGKLVVIQHLKKEFEEILKLLENEEITYREAEKEVLGIDHTLIGSWLAEKSNLPTYIVESIASHHSPEKAKEMPALSYICHFADYLVKSMDIGFSGDTVLPPVDKRIIKKLRLDCDQNGELNIEGYQNRLSKELEFKDSFINIIQGRQESKESPIARRRVLTRNA